MELNSITYMIYWIWIHFVPLFNFKTNISYFQFPTFYYLNSIFNVTHKHLEGILVPMASIIQLSNNNYYKVEDANHLTICKPPTKDHLNYSKLLECLKKFMKVKNVIAFGILYVYIIWLQTFTTTYLGFYASFYDWIFNHIKHRKFLIIIKTGQWFQPQMWLTPSD